MTIQSTAPPQARVQTKSTEKIKDHRATTDKSGSTPGKSIKACLSTDKDWYYFWYKIPGQKQNANGSGKSINCRKYQSPGSKRPWRATHSKKVCTSITRRLLRLMAHQAIVGDMSSTNSSVSKSPSPTRPAHDLGLNRQRGARRSAIFERPTRVNDPVVNETLRRWDMLNVCCKALRSAGMTPEQKAESLRALLSGTLIDNAMGATQVK